MGQVQQRPTSISLRIAANFTIEPIEEFLAYWLVATEDSCGNPLRALQPGISAAPRGRPSAVKPGRH